MTGPGDDDREADQLTSTPRIPRAPIVAALVVLAATGITAGVLAHPKHHSVAAPRPTPTAAPSTPPAPMPSAIPVADRLSVFIEHLPECTTSDHQRAFSVAMRVTNLSGRPLRLIQVRAKSDGGPGVVGTGVRIGGGRCAANGTSRDVVLAPARTVVVRLGFIVDWPTCPRDVVVSGMVFFRLAGQLLHADSSTLANVPQFNFPECR